MSDALTGPDGLTIADAWTLAISDILDVIALAIDRLDDTARTALDHAIADEAADYANAEGLAQRARAARNYINRNN